MKPTQSMKEYWEQAKANVNDVGNPQLCNKGELFYVGSREENSEPMRIEWDGKKSNLLRINGKWVRLIFDKEWAWNVTGDGIRTIRADVVEFVQDMLSEAMRLPCGVENWCHSMLQSAFKNCKAV